MKNKKAIGAVVATALLLVVAVATIVGFQSWYQDFSSGTFGDVEQKSADSSSNSGIETVVGSDLYFKNGFGENITIESVRIGDNDCDINGTYDSGVKSLSLGNNCTQNLTSSTPDVIVTTDKGVFVKRVYMKNLNLNINNIYQNLNVNPMVVWNLTYFVDISYDEYYSDLVINSNDEIFVTGYIDKGLNKDIYLAKINSNGTLNWEYTYDVGNWDSGEGLAIDSSGNIYLIGKIDSGSQNIYVAKFNDSGTKLWEKSYDFFAATDIGKGIAVDRNGNIVFGGYYANSGYKFTLYKLDFNGNLIWNKNFEVGTNNIGGKIAIDSNNNIIFGGSINNVSNNDVFLAKFNESGSMLWNKTYIGPGFEYVSSLKIDNLDNIYVTQTSSGIGYLKYDSNGNFISESGYSGAKGIAIDDNHIYLSGTTTKNNLNLNTIFVYNSTNEYVLNISFNDTKNITNLGMGINPSKNNLFLIGKRFDVNNDFHVVKYNIFN